VAVISCPAFLKTNMLIMTLEQIKDLSVLIVGDLVLSGLIKDCTGTNDETEFEFQDVIVETLCQRFKVENE